MIEDPSMLLDLLLTAQRPVKLSVLVLCVGSQYWAIIKHLSTLVFNQWSWSCKIGSKKITNLEFYVLCKTLLIGIFVNLAFMIWINAKIKSHGFAASRFHNNPIFEVRLSNYFFAKFRKIYVVMMFICFYFFRIFAYSKHNNPCLNWKFCNPARGMS